MMKMMKTILWLMIVSTFAIFDSTAASNRICEDKIVEPTNGHRQPRFVPQRLFATGSMIRFTCDDGYHLAPGTLPVQTCAEGVDGVARWVPSQAPHCVADAGCVFAVVDEELQVMPKKKFYDVGELIEYYCPFTAKDQFAVCLPNSTWSVDPLPCRRELRACDRPSVPAFGHMDCYIKDYGIPDALECPHMFMRGESVKFTCQQGFVLNSLSGDVWTCGYNGVWLGINHTMASLSPRPVCLMPGCASVDGSKLGSAMRDGEFKDENEVGLMGNVPSVACVVLVVLLLVILVFFCQPKLKSIKRRWRDLREDENRLVVNGQTVQLPSYEQVDPNTTATTVTTTTEQQQSNLLNSLSRPPNNIRHNDVTPVILLSSLPRHQQSLWRNEHEVSHTPNTNNQSGNRHQMNDDVLQTGNDDVNDEGDDVSCLLSLTPPPTTTTNNTVATDNHPTTSMLLRHNDDDVRTDETMTQSFDDSFVNSNVVMMTHDNHDDVTTPCSPHDDDKLSSPHHNISFFSVMASDVQGVAPVGVGDGETEPKDATTGSTTQATQQHDDGKEWTSL